MHSVKLFGRKLAKRVPGALHRQGDAGVVLWPRCRRLLLCKPDFMRVVERCAGLSARFPVRPASLVSTVFGVGSIKSLLSDLPGVGTSGPLASDEPTCPTLRKPHRP
jgi:hypothetical protein